MMKTSLVMACVLLSVSAAPAPEPQKTSAKLQWSPSDAQVYSTATGQQVVVPESTVLRVSDAAVAPSYHHSRSVYQSTLGSPLYAVSPVAGAVVPYSSTGRTTITTVGQPGSLPDGYVWEHQGTSHIGHTSQAIHVKKQSGLAYANPAYPVSSIPASAYSPYIPNAPAVLQPVPLSLTSYALNAAARHGEVRIIGGRHAQYLNNQWYYISPEAAAIATGSAAYPLNAPWNAAGYQTVVLANGQKVNTYAPSVIPRPAVADNKWYTKTNVRSVATPFYAQAPQYVEVAQSAIKPVSETESEKDW